MFRPGGYWQTQKALLYPTPADQSIPDRPLVSQYVFRRGGFWQVQRIISVPAPPAPFDPAIPDRPLVPQYVFRRGGFWQTSKFALWPQLTDPVITPPPPPPPFVQVGGELGHVISDTWRGIGWINPLVFDLPLADRRAVFLALLASGAISEEEFIALLAAN